MRAAVRPSQIFGMAVIGVLFGSYGLIVLIRKLRFQRLSARLGATYIRDGMFAPGRVVGDDFTIEARLRRMVTSSTYRTRIHVAVRSTPGFYLVKRNFFRDFPDWNFAKVLGIQNERFFTTTLAIPRYALSSTEQQSNLLEWLRRTRLFDAREMYQAMKKFRIREIRIEDGSLTVSFPGAVSNFKRLEGTLELLRGLGR